LLGGKKKGEEGKKGGIVEEELGTGFSASFRKKRRQDTPTMTAIFGKKVENIRRSRVFPTTFLSFPLVEERRGKGRRRKIPFSCQSIFLKGKAKKKRGKEGRAVVLKEKRGERGGEKARNLFALSFFALFHQQTGKGRRGAELLGIENFRKKTRVKGELISQGQEAISKPVGNKKPFPWINWEKRRGKKRKRGGVFLPGLRFS